MSYDDYPDYGNGDFGRLSARDYGSGYGAPPQPPQYRGSISGIPPPPQPPQSRGSINGIPSQYPDTVLTVAARRSAQEGKFKYKFNDINAKITDPNGTKNYPTKDSFFVVPSVADPKVWSQFNWHLTAGLYFTNSNALSATGPTITMLNAQIKALEDLGVGGMFSKGGLNEAQKNSLAELKLSKTHLEDIYNTTIKGSIKTYYYLPEFKIKCSGAFTFDIAEKKILQTSLTTQFSPEKIGIRPLHPKLSTLKSLFSGSKVDEFIKNQTKSKDVIIFNYACEFFSCIAQCGIIKLNYVYIYPTERISAKEQFKESFVLTGGGTTIVDLKIPFVAPDKAADFSSANANSATIDEFGGIFEALKTEFIASAKNDQVLIQKYTQILNQEDLKNPALLLNDNHQLRNELEILYFFNDRLNFIAETKKKEDDDAGDDIKNRRDATKFAMASIFSRLNSNMIANTKFEPTVDILEKNTADLFSPEPSQNNYSTRPVSARDLYSNANEYAGGAISRRPCTNPFFRRSNIIGKFLMNLRKRIRNKPMRPRKTKRNNKSKRRNKKSKRRQ